MMSNHEFENRLNTLSLFGALILNSFILIMLASTFKIDNLKNIMPDPVTKCFQCELIKEELKEEEPLPKTEAIKAVPAPVIKEPEPIIEKKIEVIKKTEKKQPKIIKKAGAPKVIDKQVVTNEPAPELVSDISAQSEDIADAGDVLPQTENISNSSGANQTVSHSRGATGTSESGGVNINGDLKNALISRIIYLLEKEKFYPHFARKTGITGTVRLNFVIDDTGKIISYSLANNNGHKILLDAALETARRVAANPVLTVQLNEKMNIIVPIRYELKN